MTWYLVFFLSSSGANSQILMHHLEFSSLEACGIARKKLVDSYELKDMSWPPLVAECVKK